MKHNPKPKFLTPEQIEHLAIKNREAARRRLKEEQRKDWEALDNKKKPIYIDRSGSYDPPVDEVDHRELFRIAKKKPFED